MDYQRPWIWWLTCSHFNVSLHDSVNESVTLTAHHLTMNLKATKKAPQTDAKLWQLRTWALDCLLNSNESFASVLQNDTRSLQRELLIFLLFWWILLSFRILCFIRINFVQPHVDCLANAANAASRSESYKEVEQLITNEDITTGMKSIVSPFSAAIAFKFFLSPILLEPHIPHTYDRLKDQCLSYLWFYLVIISCEWVEKSSPVCCDSECDVNHCNVVSRYEPSTVHKERKSMTLPIVIVFLLPLHSGLSVGNLIRGRTFAQSSISSCKCRSAFEVEHCFQHKVSIPVYCNTVFNNLTLV